MASTYAVSDPENFQSEGEGVRPKSVPFPPKKEGVEETQNCSKLHYFTDSCLIMFLNRRAIISPSIVNNDNIGYCGTSMRMGLKSQLILWKQTQLEGLLSIRYLKYTP